MKKIIYILLLVAIALSFMGCPTVYKDRDYDCLPVGDIAGNMDGWSGTAVTEIPGVSGGLKTASITATADNFEFKLRVVAGQWAGDYGFAAVKAGKLPYGVELVDADGNVKLTGIKVGSAYHFEFVTVAPTIEVNLFED